MNWKLKAKIQNLVDLLPSILSYPNLLVGFRETLALSKTVNLIRQVV